MSGECEHASPGVVMMSQTGKSRNYGISVQLLKPGTSRGICMHIRTCPVPGLGLESWLNAAPIKSYPCAAP